MASATRWRASSPLPAAATAAEGARGRRLARGPHAYRTSGHLLVPRSTPASGEPPALGRISRCRAHSIRSGAPRPPPQRSGVDTRREDRHILNQCPLVGNPPSSLLISRRATAGEARGRAPVDRADRGREHSTGSVRRSAATCRATSRCACGVTCRACARSGSCAGSRRHSARSSRGATFGSSTIPFRATTRTSSSKRETGSPSRAG